MEKPQFKVGDIVFHVNNHCYCEIIELTDGNSGSYSQYRIKEVTKSPYGLNSDFLYFSGDVYLRKLTKLEKALK